MKKTTSLIIALILATVLVNAYCETIPAALFCDDAETGNLSQKWITTYEGYEATYSNYTNKLNYTGNKSIMLDYASGSNTIFLNTTSFLTGQPFNLTMKVRTNNTNAYDDDWLYLADADPSSPSGTELYVSVWNTSVANITNTTTNAWYNVQIIYNGSHIFNNLDNQEQDVSAYGPGFPSMDQFYLAVSNGGKVYYLDNVVITNYTLPTTPPVTPPTNTTNAYTPTYDTGDAGPAVIDLIVGVLAGIAGFAILIGLGYALSLVTKHFKFLKIK